MRLTLVTETYPPEVNGVAMTLERLVHGMRSRGHDVRVVRPRQASDDGARANGEHLVASIPLPFYPELRLGLPARRALRALWRSERPDVVHVATEGFLGISARRAAADLRLPVTSSYHTNFDQFSLHYGMAKVLAPFLEAQLKTFHNRTRATLVPSPSVEERLRAAGYRNVRILGRGVDLDAFTPDRRAEHKREAWGVSEEELAIVHVGRLAPEKNLDLAIEAYRQVRARRDDARLILVGDGPSRASLEKLEGAVLVGMVPHREVGAHLASGDLFLFPSLTETFGNVLTEALACGLATVSFDYAASAAHVVHLESGLKAPFGDAAAFVHEAVRAATDEDLRRRLGAAALDTGRALGWPRVVDQFQDALARAMRRPEEDAA